MSERVPPNDLDAEAAVLSAVLLAPEALDRVAPIVAPPHFYADANRRIFEAAIDLRGQGIPSDAVAVASWLRDRGILGQVGGTPYIGQLADKTPSVANVEHHARIIWQKWRIRQAIQVCLVGQAEGYEPMEDPEEYLQKLELSLSEIGGQSAAPKMEAVGEVLVRTLRDTLGENPRDGSAAPVKTGFTELDRMLVGLYRSDLIILAARPGLGKTSLATSLAAAISRPRHDGSPGHAVAFFSLEMAREQLAMRFGCHEAEVDISRVRGNLLAREDWTKLTAAAATLQRTPIYIDDASQLTLIELRSRIRQLKRQLPHSPIPSLGLGLVAVDYLQLMKAELGNKNANREQEVSAISRGLKSIAKDENIPLVALSQLNRHVERNSSKRPGLADLRDSGAIEQDADTVLFIYRDDYYDKAAQNRGVAEVIVGKQRNGPTGSFEMRFRDSCARFYNLASEHYNDWDHEGDDWRD